MRITIRKLRRLIREAMKVSTPDPDASWKKPPPGEEEEEGDEEKHEACELNEFDAVTDRPEVGKTIDQLAVMFKKAPPGDKSMRELEQMVAQLQAKYKEVSRPRSRVKAPRPWELEKEREKKGG